MALKRENDKFSAMTLQPLSGPIGLQNRTRSPKQSLAHENSLKTRKQKVFSHDSQTCIMKTTLKRESNKLLAMTLKPFSGQIGLVNRPRTPKLWAIAHENGSKT